VGKFAKTIHAKLITLRHAVSMLSPSNDKRRIERAYQPRSMEAEIFVQGEQFQQKYSIFNQIMT
jgi:hypothetical protein